LKIRQGDPEEGSVPGIGLVEKLVTKLDGKSKKKTVLKKKT
jgi:hypothetical protein